MVRFRKFFQHSCDYIFYPYFSYETYKIILDAKNTIKLHLQTYYNLKISNESTDSHINKYMK